MLHVSLGNITSPMQTAHKNTRGWPLLRYKFIHSFVVRLLLLVGRTRRSTNTIRRKRVRSSATGSRSVKLIAVAFIIGLVYLKCGFPSSAIILLHPPSKLRFHLRQLVNLFVCLLGYQYYAKPAQQIFTKLGGKLAHGPRKKPLDFGGNLDHVTLG